MKTKSIASIVGALCAVFLCEHHSFGQDISGTSLNISGTATIGALSSGTGSIGSLTSGTATIGVLNAAGLVTL